LNILSFKIPLRDEHGTIVGIVGATHDITEQKRIEEALRHEKSLLDALMDNIPDSIYFKDRQSHHLRINRKEMRDLNVDDMSQIVGKTDVDLWGEEHGRKSFTIEQRMMESGEPIIGLIEGRQMENGQTYWSWTTKVPLHDDSGQIVGLVGITRGISDLMNAQESLQRERNLLRTLIDHLPDAVSVKDVQYRKVIANVADVHFMGLQSEAEALGKDDFELFPKELAEGFIVDDRTVIQTGQPVINREEYVIDKQGQKRWLVTSKLPLQDEKGQTIGLVCISRDITERKKAEAEREKLITQLQDALADVKLLSGLVPICANCKKIRDDQGYWTQIESYIQDRSDAKFSHSICPDCAKKLYPNYNIKK
jgi:PAS domain S-box-containing protein